MGESDDFPFEESDFETVDEYLDEENNLYSSDTNENMESVKNLIDVESEVGETNEKNAPEEISLENIDKDNTQESTISYEQSTSGNAIDFTADITLDQLGDEDVMEDLSEVENIGLDSENFGIKSEEMDVDRSSIVHLSQQEPKQNIQSIRKLQNSGVTVVDMSSTEDNKCEKPSQEQWYNEQINSKVKTVVERLTKLARVLKSSYPCYKKILGQIEAKIGNPVCELEPPRRCPLNRPHINRWKFMCTKKYRKEVASCNTKSDSKNGTFWQLEPCEISSTITNSTLQIIPNIVLRAVKMFEDFINSIDHIVPSVIIGSEMNDDDVIVLENDEKPSVGSLIDEIQSSESQPQWLWLLVRSNSKDELMMFATGRGINCNIMERLKQLFESGLGKDCNVKSLYCKSMTSMNNIQISNTTFLVGAEALDETVGELKIQLAPKTNFWLSTAGAEVLAKTVEHFLDPPELGTVIDIGCGLGLIGLSIAKKCFEVIGVDSPSEIEEAEMTCELNKIKNAYFLMGEPTQVMTTIHKRVEWRRTSAIINVNTKIGRTPEVMMGLRKIPNLRRIVMITTLTRQSVSPILELIRPADNNLGDPFIALRAIVVDTLPIGPQFEVVILMERRPMSQMLSAVLSQVSTDVDIENPNKADKNFPKNNNTEKCAGKQSNVVKCTVGLGNRKNRILDKKLSAPGAKSGLRNNGKQNDKLNKSPVKKFVKNPFYDKPSPAKNSKKNPKQKKAANVVKTISLNQRKLAASARPQNNLKSLRKNNADSLLNTKSNVNNASFHLPGNLQKRKHNWDIESGVKRSAFVDKNSRENDVNLHARMSDSQCIESDLLQKVQEQECLLKVAKQKLNSSSRLGEDLNAQEVQDMLNLAIEQANHIKNQIPCSVSDRVAPYEHTSPDVIIQDEIMINGRRTQRINQNDTIIKVSNEECSQTFDATWLYNRSSNVPPLEPNLIMPMDKYSAIEPDTKKYKSQQQNDLKKENETRWIPPSCTRRPLISSKDECLSQSERLSMSRSNFQSHSYQQASLHQQEIATQRQVPPVSRQFTTMQKSLSPPREKISMFPQKQSLIQRPLSPFRPPSPQRRQLLSTGIGDDWDIPSRNVLEQQIKWQRTIDIRPQSNKQNRWECNSQQDKFREGNNFDSNRAQRNWGNDSYVNKSYGGSNTWNSKQLAMKQSNSNQWQQEQRLTLAHNRLNTPSTNDWNAQDEKSFKSVNNTRQELWQNANKERCNEPQRNEHSWNHSVNQDDWNDLPEDARDPWGDDGGFNVTQERWNINQRSNERPMLKDNWRNPQPSMTQLKPQWQTNSNLFNQNNNNAHWSGRTVSNDNINKPTHNANWQPGPSNNAHWTGRTVSNDNINKPTHNANWRPGPSNNAIGNSNIYNNNYNNARRQQNSFGGFHRRP